MSGIKIPVTADFDKGDLTQAIQQFTQEFNRLGSSIAAANKVKFSPIDKATIEDMRKVNAQFDSLRKVSGDLNKRLNATGQKGSGFLQVDWSKLYPDQHSRNRQMQKAFEYVSGSTFGAGANGAPGARPPGGAGGGGGQGGGGGGGGGGSGAGGGQGRRIVGAGLNALGPVGGVANGALSAGMAGGIGAGLAGLGGGLAALAIGKAIGMVKEKVGAVEGEMVGYDTLKRTLGDVNVGFNALKESLRSASYGIGVTFDEGQRLALQYTKQSGISGTDHRGLAEDVNTAGGFSRSFGMDPSQGVGFFAQMRQSRATGDDQQSRRLALLIGEGIAKSGAFSKADEVLEAIADHTQSQTRGGMNTANVEAYTSMLAGMVGTKMPGMDVGNSAAMLARMNQSISGGGAAGEAGQNFLYSALGGRGMDPMDVAVLQEQGLFGTGRKAFGQGSAYSRYAGKYGLGTPDAANSDTTNFEAIQKHFEKTYGAGGQSRKLMANAMSNLYGINNSQAMAISTVDPAQLGGMGRRLDRLGINVKDVNASGISAMAQIEGDSSLSEQDKDKKIREAAATGQEQTQGKDIRDSKTAIENLQSEVATKLIPLTQAMRDGILYLAGDRGKMSGRQIQEAMATADSNDRKEQLGTEYEKRLRAAGGARGKAKEDVDALFTKNRAKVLAGEMTVEEHQREMQPLLDRQQEAIKKDAEAREWHTKAIKEEEELLRQNIEKIRDANTLTTGSIGGTNAAAGGGRGFINPPRGTETGASAPAAGSDDAMQYFVGKGWTREQAAGIVANLSAESNLRPGAVGDGGQAYGVAQWHPDRQANFEKWAGKSIQGSSQQEQYGFVHHELTAGAEQDAGGRLRRAQTAGEAGGIVSRYYERPKYTEAEATSRAAAAERLAARERGTPAPEKPAGGAAENTVGVTGQAAVTVTLQYPDGRKAAPDQAVPVRLASPQPSGK